MVVVLSRSLMPCTEIAGWKKSKMLLLSMTLRVLLFGLADPSDIIPLVGRFAPVGVLNRIVPVATAEVPVDEPSTEQFVTVLPEAPLMKRIVLVPAVGSAVV